LPGRQLPIKLVEIAKLDVTESGIKVGAMSLLVYQGDVEDSRSLIQYFRNEAAKLRNLRKLVIRRDKTVVLDVNGDGLEFPNLTYACPALDDLLHELGVIYNPQTLHNPNATPSGVKEFDLSGRWTWGHDRIL
jgi:hypothetical protein